MMSQDTPPQSPEEVCCHTCHREPGQLCKAWIKGEERCHTRVKHYETQKAKRTCPVCLGYLDPEQQRLRALNLKK